MTTFNTALDRLKVLLETSPELIAFAEQKWSKVFTVTRTFKTRPQINTSDLPRISLSRPGLSHGPRLSGGSDNQHSVILVIGFHQDNADLAPAEIVEVEEIIDDVLTSNYRIKDAQGIPLVKNVTPGESMNFEGFLHPDYFIIKEVEIEHYR